MKNKKEIKKWRQMVGKEWDFEPENKEINQKLKELEKLLIKFFGKRCKTKANQCLSCRIWIAFDNLKINL